MNYDGAHICRDSGSDVSDWRQRYEFPREEEEEEEEGVRACVRAGITIPMARPYYRKALSCEIV